MKIKYIRFLSTAALFIVVVALVFLCVDAVAVDVDVVVVFAANVLLLFWFSGRSFLWYILLLYSSRLFLFYFFITFCLSDSMGK